MTSRKVIALQAETVSEGAHSNSASPFHEFPDLPQWPVSSPPSVDAYFETPELQELQQNLLQDMPRSGAVFLVEGDAGSGKSALLRQFTQGMPADWLLCSVRARMAMGEVQLLASLYKGFNLAPAGCPALTQQLMAWAREGRVMVIVVDDADNLSPFAIQALLHIKQALNAKGLQLGVVLFATPGIRAMLVAPSLASLDESLLRRLIMPHFNSRQTAAYIQHCFSSVTDDDHPYPDVDSARLSQIQRRSRGLPKAINHLVSAMLSLPDRQPSATRFLMTRTVHYRTFFLSLAGFCTLLGGVYLAFLSMGGGQVLQTPEFSQGATGIPGLTAIEVPPESTVINQRLSKTGEGRTPQVATVSVAPTPHKPPPPQRTAAVRPAKKVAPPLTIKPLTTAVVPVAPVAKSPPSPVVAQRASDSHWLQGQNRGHFTVQLTRWSDKNKAIRYIKDRGITADAAYIHTRSKGRDWYLVVYRTYPSLTAARQAIKGLPASLKKYGPWVRNISALQSAALFD